MNNLTKKKINALTKGKKKGFTLVELIIVIAIIAILAAIAVPKFAQIRRDANIKADVATAKIIHDAAVQAISEDPTITSTDIAEKTADKIEGGSASLPTPKAVSGDFEITLEDDGDITVTGDGVQVYPNMADGYGK